MKLLEYEDMDVQREYLNQMYRIQMDDIGQYKNVENQRRLALRKIERTSKLEWEDYK